MTITPCTTFLDRVLRLYNPSGRVVTERDGLETLLDLETVLIVNIKNATAGRLLDHQCSIAMSCISNPNIL